MSNGSQTSSRKFVPDAGLVEELEREVEEHARQYNEINTRYRSLVDNAPIGIVEFSVDGRINSANPAFADMLGYTGSEHLLEPIVDISNSFLSNRKIASALLTG